MKTTKDYLLLTASIALGIIIGGSVMFFVGSSFRQNAMHERMRMAPGGMHFMSNNCRGNGKMMNRGHKPWRHDLAMFGRQKPVKGGMPGIKRMIDQLDLTEEQKEQINKILESQKERFEQMQELRKSRWEASEKEIKEILTGEQIKEYDEIMSKRGGEHHAPGYMVALNRLDLTPEQKEKIANLMDRNRQMREGMWESRKEEMKKIREQIRDILNDEQKEKFDNMHRNMHGRHNMG